MMSPRKVRHPGWPVELSTPVLSVAPLSSGKGYATATLNEVSQVYLPLGQEYILALTGFPLFTDAPQS